MNEYKRVFADKKIIALLILSAVMTLFFFCREQETAYRKYTDRFQMSVRELFHSYDTFLDDYRSLSVEEASDRLDDWYQEHALSATDCEKHIYKWLFSSLTYCREYPDYLETIQKQAENMNTISIFSQPNSFSSRNIQKTAEDFFPLSHLTLSVGIDEGITRFLSFRLADYAALLMMVIISWQLLAERKSGLWEIVHCTREGRTRLAVRRCFMLLFSSVVICIFIYGTILLASFWIYGGQNDLNRPIQSIADFQRCSLPVTIREFLLQYGMIKLLSVFLVGMIVWFFLSSFSNLSIGMVILGIFLGIEYSLFYFLPVQSIWNLLKYVNLFSYIDLEELFLRYFNINLFSYPWGARTFLLLLLPFFLVIVTTGCIAVNTNKKPKESSQLLIRFSSLLHVLSNAILGRLSVCMLELYKVLFIKKGILVLILFFFYQYESIIGGEAFYGTVELYLNSYIQSVEGPFTEETTKKIAQIEQSLSEEESKAQQLSEQLSEGEITAEEYMAIFYYSGFNTLEEKRAAFEQLEAAAARIEESSKNMEQTLWIIPENGYEYLLGSASDTRSRFNALLTLFVMVMLFSHSFVCEKQNGTHYLLRSTQKGRGYLFHKKEQAGLLLTTVIFLIANSTELLNTWHLYGLHHLDVPVQSLNLLKDFPIVLPIGTYLILVYSVRFLMSVCCLYLIDLISLLASREEYSLLINIIGMILPSALYYIGIPFFKWIAIIVPISSAEILRNISHTPAGFLSMATLILAAVFARTAAIRIWGNQTT